jgi:hypothetical protein
MPALGRAFLGALPALMAPVGLVAGLLLGVAMPTELGALICIYALILGFTDRQLTSARLLAAFTETVASCGVILLLIALACHSAGSSPSRTAAATLHLPDGSGHGGAPDWRKMAVLTGQPEIARIFAHAETPGPYS